MFEELRKRLMDRYYLFQARRYVKNMNKQGNENSLSLDVVPEEVKYKILQEGLIENKELIYSFIMNLSSKEQRKEMIGKYISQDKNIPYEILEELPEPLKLEVLEKNISSYYSWDVIKIINNLSDEGVVRLFETNVQEFEHILDIDKRVKHKVDSYTNVDSFIESVVLSRFNGIESPELKERLSKVINIEELESRIEYKIYSAEGYGADSFVHEHADKLKDERKKINYLLGKEYDSRAFYILFSSLSQAGKQIVLNNIFSEKKLSEYIATKDKDRFSSVKYIGRYLSEYLEYAELDGEKLEKLFYVLDEQDSAREKVFDLAEDSVKAKIVLDDKNFFDVSNRRTDLLLKVQDEDILVHAIHDYSDKINKSRNEDRRGIYEYLLTNVDEKVLTKIVLNEISEGENVSLNLLVASLQKITDKEALKEIFSNNLNLGYFRFDKEKRVNIVNSLIAEKIIEYDLSEDILEDIDINMFSEENQFLLLLNSSKETRSKILAEHKELEDVINVINENEAILRKLSDGTTKPRNRLLFYQKIREEIEEAKYSNKSYTISEKFAMLERFQSKHDSIAETINFDFLEKDLLDEFGGIENVENLVRYPKTQQGLLRMDRRHLKVISYINSYVSKRLPNADYILNEIISEYSDSSYDVYDSIAEYIETHEEIPENVENNIFNIITNSRMYKGIFWELDREMTSDDVEHMDEIKKDFCDKVINGEIDTRNFSIKSAYLMRYYNLDLAEAEAKKKEYIEFIESLDDSPENLVLKRYIFALHNVLESNSEILAAAYKLSQNEETISRIEIEIIESAIKEKIAEEIKESLYVPDKKEYESIDVILEDGTSHEVKVYDSGDEFNMLVTVLDAYGGGNGVYENYKEQWNTNKYAQNQRICTTYIGNNSLMTAKRENCVIYGFTEFPNRSLVKMAPYDIVSQNNTLVTTAARDAICMGPKELINKTRRYNEIDIERRDENGDKIQPSYIICFAKSIDEVNEESKKAAAQFGIPIVLIDRERLAEKEAQKVDLKLQEFLETKDVSLIDPMIESFCNNKYGSKTTIKDEKEATVLGTELTDVESLFFSDEKLAEILKTMYEVIKAEEAIGNIQKAQEIRLALKNAVVKESEKHYLWQRAFGVEFTRSPFENTVFDEVRAAWETPKEERARLDERKVREKLDFITKVDAKENSIELRKREEVFREDSYELSKVQDTISNMTEQELESVCDYTYKNNTVQNVYVLMLGKSSGLDITKIELIIKALRDDDTIEDKFSEKKKEIIKNLTSFVYHDDELRKMIKFIENPVDDLFKNSPEYTEEIFDKLVEKGLIDEENAAESLDDKIELILSCNKSNARNVIDGIRMSNLDDESKTSVLWEIESYMYISGGLHEETFNYVKNLSEEERKEFFLMAKVLCDARNLAGIAEGERKEYRLPELFLEESERYLPSSIQLQEAFANQRLDEVVEKEGYGDRKTEIKEKLLEDGRSPVEYAYELDRFIEKKHVNEKGEEDGAR